MGSGSLDQKSEEPNRYARGWLFGGLMASLGGVMVYGGIKFYTRFLKRIPNGNHVTPDAFAQKRWIKGVVTSVGDADGFRLYHTPFPSLLCRVPKSPRDLKNQTISIRIAGVDAPEGGHFGREAQPFAAESHTWLKKLILGKKVRCQLLHRDQYSRIVANVSWRRRHKFFAQNLAIEMLRAGWATTYEQSSAQYGKEGKNAYMAAEKVAKAKRRGIWKRGTSIETPAEYKRKHAQPTEARSQDDPTK